MDKTGENVILSGGFAEKQRKLPLGMKEKACISIPSACTFMLNNASVPPLSAPEIARVFKVYL